MLEINNHKLLNSEIQRGIKSLAAGKGLIITPNDFEKRRRQLRSRCLSTQNKRSSQKN